MVKINAGMNEINSAEKAIDLHRIDMNLLLAFDVLMKTRNVTEASKKLFVSQSAMSHTLKRLRELFDDPLLVSASGVMQPTPRALALEPELRDCLANLEKILNPQSVFDPGLASNCFTLGSTDYVEYVFLPPLIEKISRLAPNVNIRLKRFDLGNIERHLAQGDIDIAISLKGRGKGRSTVSRSLIDEKPVALVRVDHPEIKEGLTLEQYINAGHIVIDSMEVSDIIDHRLMELGLERRIQLRAPNFLSAPIILAETDMVASLPRHIAERFIKGGRLKILPLPVELEHFELRMFWHQLQDKDPAQQWFRAQIQRVADGLL